MGGQQRQEALGEFVQGYQGQRNGAKDGSGNNKTVKEAIASAPTDSRTRYVIHVKKGTYKENVKIVRKQKNVTLVGDGMDSTIVTAAVGDGFIAQGICFEITAGPQKHRAVVLRVGADQAFTNRCNITGYQDTPYAHSNR